MKKLLLILALLCSPLIQAATLSVEYDYAHVSSNPDGWESSNYGYIGVTVPIGELGLVDFGVQGVYSQNTWGNDRQSGWELGYTYPLAYGAVNFLPRVAYGSMSRINLEGTDDQLSARYYLVSIEANTPITNQFGAYTSYSHMGAANADSITSANRFQIGIDTTITKEFVLRTGYSWQRFGPYTLNALVIIGMYSF